MDLDRLYQHSWFRGKALAPATVLLCGVGAVGLKILEHLVRSGVRSIYVLDRDTVEPTNLSCAYTYYDIGMRKVDAAAFRMRQINPEVDIIPIYGDLEFDLSWGLLRKVDLVIAALDSRRARMALNEHACFTRTPYLDVGVDGESMSLALRLYRPTSEQDFACYLCGFHPEDFALLEQRMACGENRKNEGLTNSLIAGTAAAFAAAEALKFLMGDESFCGHELRLNMEHQVLLPPAKLPPNPECLCAHGHYVDKKNLMVVGPVESTTLMQVWKRAGRRLGTNLRLELGRELARAVQCGCGNSSAHQLINPRTLRCSACGKERQPTLQTHTLGKSDLEELGGFTFTELGFPTGDIIAARAGDRELFIEFKTEEA